MRFFVNLIEINLDDVKMWMETEGTFSHCEEFDTFEQAQAYVDEYKHNCDWEISDESGESVASDYETLHAIYEAWKNDRPFESKVEYEAWLRESVSDFAEKKRAKNK